MQKRENNLSGAWFPTKLYLYYSRALKRMEETAEHGSIAPNPWAPTPSLRVLQQQRGGLAPARWGGKGGQERQRPLQNWRAWDETLVPRAKEEVRSCDVFSVGSQQLGVDARMKAPYQREQKGDPAVLWGTVVHLPAVVPDYARCNYPMNNCHTWWSGLFVCSCCAVCVCVDTPHAYIPT